MSRELFGTDGVRGLAGTYPFDTDGMRTIGRAVGTYFAKAGQQIVIGCDPRESSDALVTDIIQGLNSVGVSTVSVGVITTPGLAFLARENDEFVAGVMITASHNPYQYNGVKVFDDHGDKLPDDVEVKLNMLIKDGVPDRDSGTARAKVELVKTYEDFLVNSAKGLKLDGLRLAIDTANGAASGFAEKVFKRLGAEVTPLFNSPDGQNINAGCGAADTEALRNTVIENKLYLGIALDGDADRLSMIDAKGRQITGDHILYILAVSGNLKGVVATVMSNLGFEQTLQKKGINLERVQVGDRYVLEGLKATGYTLGGEQSGHIILPELLKTGDGLLAAVQVARAIHESGKSLSDWFDEVEIVPQALVNIPLADKSLLERPEVQEFITQASRELGNGGRLLIRPSGTEPLARVMVEAQDAENTAIRISKELEELLQ